jgi:hypothetical protein
MHPIHCFSDILIESRENQNRKNSNQYIFYTILKYFILFFFVFWFVCDYITSLWLRNHDSGESNPSKSPGDCTRLKPHQPLTKLDFLSPHISNK